MTTTMSRSSRIHRLRRWISGGANIALKVFVGMLLIGWIQSANAQQTARTTPGDATRDTRAEIQELIEKLGSDSYATRMRARNRLKRYGLEAFDALREAQDHLDNEVVSAARYLISSLHVSWSTERDPKAVREILFEYGAQEDPERLARIELLGQLPASSAGEALARLARFEPKINLSRHAALLLLKQPIEGDEQELKARSERLVETLKGNDRDSVRWLLAYAADMQDQQFRIERWQEILNRQRRVVDSGANPNVTSESVLELVRVLTTRALAEDLFDKAMELARSHVDLVSSDSSDLADHCQWAIQRKLYPVVIDLYQRNLHPFGRNAGLLYSVAQAYRETDQLDSAEEIAEKAFQINPYPEKKPKTDDEEVVEDRELIEIGDAHSSVARMLLYRGRFDWAERELLAVIEKCSIESSTGRNARLELANAYAERLRHDEVSSILFPIVDRLEKDSQYREKLNNQLQPVYLFESTYLFAKGLAALDEQRIDDAKKLLVDAYGKDRSNIDILIAMYRIKDTDDADWDNTVQSSIIQQTKETDRRISQYEAAIKRSNDPGLGIRLAKYLNQYAWLVSNTAGDKEKALKYILRSLDLTDQEYPDAYSARLDTCARCYFALGKIDQAIETQKRAIETFAHSPQMKRQLIEFQDAKKATKASE